jgi:hypothetical protein
VHQGFLKSWTSNGLNATIVARMKEAVDKMQDDGSKVKLYVTGAGGLAVRLRSYFLFQQQSWYENDPRLDDTWPRKGPSFQGLYQLSSSLRRC